MKAFVNDHGNQKLPGSLNKQRFIEENRIPESPVGVNFCPIGYRRCVRTKFLREIQLRKRLSMQGKSLEIRGSIAMFVVSQTRTVDGSGFAGLLTIHAISSISSNKIRIMKRFL